MSSINREFILKILSIVMRGGCVTFCVLSVLALRPSTRVDMSSLTVLFICDCEAQARVRQGWARDGP